ncbi:MAG: NUDIX domain-containing protein [Thiotrichales bacterium]|nr:NUDIX domain-containing protein [Thiotrichales bacterium]
MPDRDLFHQCLPLPGYCPKCGTRQLLQDSGKSLRCAACDFLYFHNVAATSSAIIETPDRFLMVQRAHEPCSGMLDFPGGFVEKDETAEAALRRELQEELGLGYAGELDYLCTYTNTYNYSGINYHTLDLYFLIRFDDTPGLSSNDDVAAYEWLDRNNIPEQRIGFVSVQNACRHYRRYRSGHA